MDPRMFCNNEVFPEPSAVETKVSSMHSSPTVNIMNGEKC